MRVLIALLIVSGASTAHAFSDPDLFAMPVSTGGGGGRYFTGSRADGYSCSVCHTGAPEPKVVIDGLPDTLVTGERYPLVVHWDRPEVALGLQLELTTPGTTHPSVEVTPAAEQPAESRCDQDPAGLSAVYTFDVGGRRIVGVSDCHAQRVDLSFVANGETIVLAIGAVRSDGSGTATGDGTFERRITLGSKLVASGGGGCDVIGRAPDRGSLWPLLLASIALRRRRHGNSSPARIVTSRAHT